MKQIRGQKNLSFKRTIERKDLEKPPFDSGCKIGSKLAARECPLCAETGSSNRWKMSKIASAIPPTADIKLILVKMSAADPSGHAGFTLDGMIYDRFPR